MSRKQLVTLLALLMSTPGAVSAAQLTVINHDGPGEGFNDATPVAPVTGNSATTRGGQRLNAFRAAANAWGAILESDVLIQIEAEINSLECDATSAVLGSASAWSVFRDFSNAPRALTWYPVALASSLAGEDLDSTDPDLFARFNGRLDSDPNCLTGIDWWYGIGAPAPSGTLDFYRVVLHEIGHGLGFATFVDLTSGEQFFGRDDIYMTQLEDHSTGKRWPDMTNAERRASALDTGDLHWTGNQVAAHREVLQAGAHPSGHVQMYAPSPLQLGSSVSHWDTALSPNELMEPFLLNSSADLLTTHALADLGWQVQAGSSDCTPDADTMCLNQGRFKVEVIWTDFAGNSGAGRVVAAGTVDSGLFWFFNASNWELLVKVLNGCNNNNHYWVYAAATTNVAYTLTVTDTQHDAMVEYSNVLGVSSPATTDNRAFDTCP